MKQTHIVIVEREKKNPKHPFQINYATKKALKDLNIAYSIEKVSEKDVNFLMNVLENHEDSSETGIYCLLGQNRKIENTLIDTKFLNSLPNFEKVETTCDLLDLLFETYGDLTLKDFLDIVCQRIPSLFSQVFTLENGFWTTGVRDVITNKREDYVF